MKVTGFLLIAFIFITFVPHADVALATDFVKVHGYVYDTEGNPIEGITVQVYGLSPPHVEYGHTSTDGRGHYALSLDRPKRLDFPVFYKGRPVYEGYWINVCSVLTDGQVWMPTFCNTVNMENKNVIEQNFTLKPAGTVKLRGYSPDGTLIEKYPPADPWISVYTTDLHWVVIRSEFIPDFGMFVLSLDTPQVLNFPWNVPGFGKVILRADNDGKGFTLTRQGETITINLNYELAKTQFRFLRESYERYLDEGYLFSTKIRLNIRFANEILKKVGSSADDVQKAHFADLCLNQTLWAAEDLEVQKALQDIEKYRKGNAILRVVDENDKPMESVDIAISQIGHDFLFGALTEGSADPSAYRVLKEAGINYGLLQFYWRATEPSLGQYNLEAHQPISSVDSLRKMGIRLGAEGLIVLEPGGNVWDTGLLNLSFEELRAKIYEHVYKLVSSYSDYIDSWIVVHNPHLQYHCLGFTREQNIDLIQAGIAAVRNADPTARILVYVDHICGWLTAIAYEGGDDRYTVDPYTFLSHINEYGIDHDGISLCLIYGSVDEWGGETEKKISGGQSPYPFRDLASISRLLDWYSTLSKPIHITEFNVPGNFASNLGYWHRRTWDEKLQAEWIEKFYTIAFSKALMREITYWSARDNWYMKAQRGLLDVNYVPRESFFKLKTLITENWTTRLHMKTDANGQLEFRGFAGDYDITVSAQDLTKNFTIHVFEGESKAYQIKFDRHEVLKEMEAQRVRLRNDAKSVLQELDRIRQWLETVSEVKSAEILDEMNSLMSLYEEGNYSQVIRLGRALIENPMNIQLKGKLSDLEGLSPLLRDRENDVAALSPLGTDIVAVYAFADSSNLYIAIRVLGDNPNRSATFTVEISTDSGRFHVALRRNGTEASCWEEPWKEGNIYFNCPYGLGEIVEIQIPLLSLKSPETIYLSNVWIWEESTKRNFDSYDGPRITIPDLRSFKPATTLEIEKTETTYTTAIAISPPIESSLPYIALVSAVIILSVVIYWRKRKVRPSGKKTP